MVVATGQSKLAGLLAEVPGLKFEKGRLLTDPKTGMTGNPKIFAGGDLTNGGKEVVNAVAEGKRAALAIDAQFKISARERMAAALLNPDLNLTETSRS